MKKIIFLLSLTVVIFASVHLVGATEVINDTLQVQSLKVGQQGIGGVTFFNGTIVNETTGAENSDVPVTFGDNVRIDGRIYRGATAGTGDDMPFIINDDAQVVGNLNVGSLNLTTLGSLSCSSGQVAKWNGSQWACSADNDDDTLGAQNCNDGETIQLNGDEWECVDYVADEIALFINCIDQYIELQGTILLADWDVCKALFL